MSMKDTQSLRKYHIAFGVACALLLALTLGSFLQDSFDREYVDHQRAYLESETRRLSEQKDQIEKELGIARDRRERLEAKRDEAARVRDENKQAIAKARERLETLRGDLGRAQRKLNSEGAEVLAARFRFTTGKSDRERVAQHEKARRDRFEEVKRIEADIREQEKALDEHEMPLRNAEQALEGHTQKLTELNRALLKLKGHKTVNAIRDLPLLDFVSPRWNLNDQKVLKDLPQDLFFAKTPRVDRCIACHKAIANPDPLYAPKAGPGSRNAQDVAKVLQAHPRLDLFVASNSPHPAALFGCTVCHRGRPMGVSFTRAAHSPRNEAQRKRWGEEYGWDTLDHHKPGLPLWDEPMLPVQYTQASCRKCHRDLDRIPEAPELNEGLRLYREHGCANCHFSGPDPDMAWMGPVGPDLRRIGGKTNASWLREWISDPWIFRPATRMPKSLGLENRVSDVLSPAEGGERPVPQDTVEAEAIATYLLVTANLHTIKLPPAPAGDAQDGRELYEIAGCVACHSTDEANTSHQFSDHGPDLSRIGDKVTAAWLYSWLRQPNRHWLASRMPSMRLTENEAADITAYLMTEMVSNRKVTQKPDNAADRDVDALVSRLLESNTTDAKIAERLKNPEALLRSRLGLKRQGRGEAPPEWTDALIERTLKTIEDWGAAPEEDARLKKLVFAGAELIQQYGCYACHQIQGWMHAPLNSVDLAAAGDKHVGELDFGVNSPLGRNRWEWYHAKIARPRGFDSVRAEVLPATDRLKMPWHGYRHDGDASLQSLGAGQRWSASNPDLHKSDAKGSGLTETQVQALVTALLSFTREKIPLKMQDRPDAGQLAIDRGRRVIDALNCTGCHPMGLSYPRLQDEPAAPGTLPLAALLTLGAQRAATRLGLHSDREELNLSHRESGADSYVSFGRGVYLGPTVLRMLLGERLVRKLKPGPEEPIGLVVSRKKRGPDWVPYSDLVGEARFVEMTWRIFCENPDAPSSEDATRARKEAARIYGKNTGRKVRYVNVKAYEKVAGTEALSHPDVKTELRLTSADLERRHTSGDYYEPVVLRVRGTFGEGKIVEHITEKERHRHWAPPTLAKEGIKVQPDWLYSFLREVRSLRPGLRVRMPSFWNERAHEVFPSGRRSSASTYLESPPPNRKRSPDPDDIEALVRYFNVVARERPFGHQPTLRLTSALRDQYRRGYELHLNPSEAPNGLGCILCHPIGKRTPTGTDKKTWGPDLAETKRRFKEPWLRKFLSFPAAYYPWTNMPPNFYDSTGYRYTPDEPSRGLRDNTDELRKFSAMLDAVMLYLLTSGEAGIGEVPTKQSDGTVRE